MKKLMLSVALIGSAMLFSCSTEVKVDEKKSEEPKKEEAKVEEKKDGFPELCTFESDIYLKIKGYTYSMEDNPVTFDGKFNAKRTEWTKLSDSTAQLKMYNFDLGAPDADSNLQIAVKFYSRKGKKLPNGVYEYGASDKETSSSAKIISSKGSVYFNWSMGMPQQGFAKLNFSDENQACGTFDFEVNKPDNGMFGNVVLKGNWVKK
jgi:hypothetical protein